MSGCEFGDIVNRLVEKLKSIAKTDPMRIASCKSGDDFELCVAETLKTVLKDMGVGAEIHHSPGSHAFPDIVVHFADGSKYGIEVKSSSAAKSKGWKINGNSVMGSTRDHSVIDTYIVFGKTARSKLEFRARRYEECVANVVVTHSPRYLIDMDLPSGETFFEKSGIDYEKINESDNPIGLITAYFKAQGQQAWWLTESTPAAVRMFCDISQTEQYECYGYGLAHFPELFERNSTKYKRLALWLATEQSLVHPSLRDSFAAGGKVDLVVNATAYNDLPQIFKRLIEYKEYLIKALDACDGETLCRDWGCKTRQLRTLDEKIAMWISVVATHVNRDQLPDGVEPYTLLKNILDDDK